MADESPIQSDLAALAMRAGLCAALKGDSRWAVLCAIFDSLPTGNASHRQLEQATGLSSATIKRARKSLKLLGLIDFDGNDGGKETTAYRIDGVRKMLSDAGVSCRTQSPVGHSENDAGVSCRTHPTSVSCRTLYPAGHTRGAHFDGGHNEPPLQVSGKASTGIDGKHAVSKLEMRAEKIYSGLPKIMSIRDANVTSTFSTNDKQVRKAGSGAASVSYTTQSPTGHTPATSPPPIHQLPDVAWLDELEHILEANAITDDEAEWLESQYDLVEDSACSSWPLLAIDPSSTTIGWAVFGPGSAIIASDATTVPGIDATDRITQAGRIVAGLIEQYRPAVVVLENPNYSKQCSDPRRLQTFAAATNEIEMAIAAGGLVCHRLNADRHKAPDIKRRNRHLFEERTGRPASEDQADAARLGWDFLAAENFVV